jgi:hypothetical protein
MATTRSLSGIQQITLPPLPNAEKEKCIIPAIDD